MTQRTRGTLCALAIGLALVATLPRPARAAWSWYDDAQGYQYALRRQRSDRSPVLVYFRTDWCPHCRALDALLDSREVSSRLRDYLKVSPYTLTFRPGERAEGGDGVTIVELK